MADIHKNFAYSTVNGTAYPGDAAAPGNSATTIAIQAGTAALFPTVPFNATVWATGAQPTSTNAEIVRCTALTDDTYTVTRNAEGSSTRNIQIGDQFAATITKQTLTDAENVLTSFSPYILASAGQSSQTLGTNSSQQGTGSVYVFPVTVPQNIKFNQVLMINTIGYSTVNNTMSNTYYSLFGIYSRNANALSIISRGSFSIGEVISGTNTMCWTYPVSTATTGYSMGGFPEATATTIAAFSGSRLASGQFASDVVGTKLIGMQFGGNLSLTPNVYWIGLLSYRSSAGQSTFGLSNAGIVGQLISPYNQLAQNAASGMQPFGIPYSNVSSMASNYTAWWGKHIVGFLTTQGAAAGVTNSLPDSIALGSLGTQANQIIPTVTFVST